jgi:hypothetical protein
MRLSKLNDNDHHVTLSGPGEMPSDSDSVSADVTNMPPSKGNGEVLPQVSETIVGQLQNLQSDSQTDSDMSISDSVSMIMPHCHSETGAAAAAATAVTLTDSEMYNNATSNGMQLMAIKDVADSIAAGHHRTKYDHKSGTVTDSEAGQLQVRFQIVGTGAATTETQHETDSKVTVAAASVSESCSRTGTVAVATAAAGMAVPLGNHLQDLVETPQTTLTHSRKRRRVGDNHDQSDSIGLSASELASHNLNAEIQQVEHHTLGSESDSLFGGNLSASAAAVAVAVSTTVPGESDNPESDTKSFECKLQTIIAVSFSAIFFFFFFF